MKNLLFILCYFLFNQLLFSQTVDSQKLLESKKFENNLSLSTKKMVINTTNISNTTITEFKKELLGWSHKVISSEIDSIQKTFVIIHNNKLHPLEMNDFLKKYHIKSDAIISYN
jgi:hypothetical protein